MSIPPAIRRVVRARVATFQINMAPVKNAVTMHLQIPAFQSVRSGLLVGRKQQPVVVEGLRNAGLRRRDATRRNQSNAPRDWTARMSVHRYSPMGSRGNAPPTPLLYHRRRTSTSISGTAAAGSVLDEDAMRAHGCVARDVPDTGSDDGSMASDDGSMASERMQATIGI